MLQKSMKLFMDDLMVHGDGLLDFSMVKGLATMGSTGEHQNNVWRDLKKRLPVPKLPRLHEFKIPYQHSVLGYIFETTMMLLPHELFSAIYHHYPAMWRECMWPSAEVCLRFWNSVRGGMHFQCHPVRLLPNLSKVIPLRLHGDGTPSSGVGKSWGKLVDIFSLSSMLVFGSSLLHNFMIWMVHQSLLCVAANHHTMNAFWKRFSWSCEALSTGEWPELDWNGKPIHSAMAGKKLMGGFVCYIWACVGDLDYWTKTLELPNSTSNTPCALCPANCTTHPWWHFRPDAAWIRAIYTAVEFIAGGWNKCGLFDCPGVTVYSLYPDWMHVKHLGIDKVLLGSVLWVLVHWVLPGGDPAEKLSVVWSDVLRIYQEDNVPTRYGVIKMTMFSKSSTPKLKGKASEIKCLLPVLVKVFQAYMNEDLGLHRKILSLLQLSTHLDVIIDRNSDQFALNEREANDLGACGFLFLAQLYEMSESFKNEDVALFCITAKAHYLMHICLLSRSLHFTAVVL